MKRKFAFYKHGVASIKINKSAITYFDLHFTLPLFSLYSNNTFLNWKHKNIIKYILFIFLKDMEKIFIRLLDLCDVIGQVSKL